ESCNLAAYRIGPLQPGRTIPLMSSEGMEAGPRPSASRKYASEKSVVEPTTRLLVLQRMAATISLVPATAGAVTVGAGGLVFPEKAQAAKGGEAVAKKEWISGKGAQPKGSDDKTGTRKESKYLRCLSNCLADCQKPTYGPEKDREECLQTCQDECCTSYEQCTYTVTQNK
ncbi:unnamed protein product, partial [Hapterophycus canaliculatus]